MRLSLQEKIALIYTSAGSQRNVAALIGVSHQKIGRVLRTGQEGGYLPTSRVLTDPGLIAAVENAFEIHKDITKGQARADQLPYVADVPIFSARMLHKDGQRGDRVEAEHLHWLPDKLRDAWIAGIHASKKYAVISAGSVISMMDYNRAAQSLAKGKYRDDVKLSHATTFMISTILAAFDQTGNEAILDTLPPRFRTKEGLRSMGSPDIARIFLSLQRLQLPVILGRVQTPYVSISEGSRVDDTIANINARLNEKHAGAVGEPGTRLADRILLQVDTRNGKDAKFRSANTRASKPRKARRNQKGNKSRR